MSALGDTVVLSEIDIFPCVKLLRKGLAIRIYKNLLQLAGHLW